MQRCYLRNEESPQSDRTALAGGTVYYSISDLSDDMHMVLCGYSASGDFTGWRIYSKREFNRMADVFLGSGEFASYGRAAEEWGKEIRDEKKRILSEISPRDPNALQTEQEAKIANDTALVKQIQGMFVEGITKCPDNFKPFTEFLTLPRPDGSQVPVLAVVHTCKFGQHMQASSEWPVLSCCWKFANQNSGAQFDFFALITVQKVVDIMGLMTMLIPMENGELVHFIKTAEYHSIMKSTYVKTIKSCYENYAVVQISRMTVQEYYEGTQHTIFTSGFSVCRYDSKFNLIEPCQTVSAYDFPPLPRGDPVTRGVSLEYRLSQLDLRNLRSQEAVRFPTYELDPSGDPSLITVDEGDEYKQRGMGELSIGALLVSRPPGIYIDFADQGGNPSLLVTIYSLVPEVGMPRTLFGNWCTEINYHQLHDHVFVKKRSSWFKTKTKITIVREELIVDAVRCHAI